MFIKTTKFISSIGMLISLVLFSTTIALAQGPTGSISGKVTDAQGEGISGITVSADIKASRQATSGQATTNANGVYTITGLAVGNYIISYEDPTDNYAIKYHDNVSVQAGQTSNIDVQLEPTDVLVYLPMVIKSTATPSGWSSQISNTSQDLLSVSCSSSSHCVAVGKGGTVFVSTDGNSWEAKNSGTSQQLNGVSCASGSFCVAVGNGSTILVSNDGGNSWSSKNTGGADWQAIHCPSTTLCMAPGGTGIIYTLNGGSSWQFQDAGNTPLYGVHCPNAGLCYPIGLGRIVTVIVSPPSIATKNEGERNHNDIHCTSTSTCFIISDGGEIRLTTDNHQSFTNQTSGTSSDLKGISCLNDRNCYVVGGTGNSGLILETSDGSSWNSETIAITDKILRGVSCPDTDTCVAVGDAGTILKR